MSSEFHRSEGRAALLLIDVQDAFKHPTHWGNKRSNPDCEANIARILCAFREASSKSLDSPQKPLICHVQHISHSGGIFDPTSKVDGFGGIEFQRFAQPLLDGSEPIVQKSVNSAFIGTDLEEMLRNEKISHLIIVGLTTDHCVSTTTRMAANLEVTNGIWGKGLIVLVGDATATWERGDWDAETVQAVNLASLRGEFAEVWSTDETLRWIHG